MHWRPSTGCARRQLCCPATWSIVLASHIKKYLIATERLRKKVRVARYAWRRWRMPRMHLEPHRLVFIDETAVTTKMTRLRGRSVRGSRLEATAPFGHWRTQTFIAGLRVDELTAPWVLDGPMIYQLIHLLCLKLDWMLYLTVHLYYNLI